MQRWIAGRIHYDSSGNREEIHKAFAEKTEEIIFYDHVDGKNENPHLHFLMYTDTDLRTVRNWAVKVNSSYSFKEKQTKGVNRGQPVSLDMISYFSRGELDPSYIKTNGMLTPALVAEMKDKGYNGKTGTISKNLRNALDEVKNTKRKTEWDMVQEVINAVDASGYSVFNLDQETLIYSKKEIRSVAYVVREKNKRLLPAKGMSEFVQKCQFYLNPGEYNEACDYWDAYLCGKKY